ncbi:SDR family oxidoreductase [Streptomyces iconiensis]|uniref:NmrA family NAD(P)-binding protein n=1 Tax=Streptomyces iconiensis TaxID=1384038 RepID=A0ABT7A877_9ACTN|nr:NmrA family NAD(P)-binding protein [Streptomyces iconiensis]MDJ1137542.1 NmrA family NAD(P)-binding protein [Streptomyces iconiensis]
MTEARWKHFLVTGATGFQGSAVARLLTSQGHTVRGFARHPQNASGVAPNGTEMVLGDLADRESVLRAFEGITHASVVIPLAYDREIVLSYARNIADAARSAGVERLVYNTNTPIPGARTHRPGFETRRDAEAILRKSGVPTVVLSPPVYLDNLFSPWNGPGLVNDGVLAYPLPAEQRVSWLSHADLAKATVAALEHDGLDGEVIALGGPQALTGHELADQFARGLGRDVRYLSLEVEQFESGLAQLLGNEAAAGVASIYHHVSDGRATDLLAVDAAVLERRLGIRLTPTVDWVARQPWQQWSTVGA